MAKTNIPKHYYENDEYKRLTNTKENLNGELGRSAREMIHNFEALFNTGDKSLSEVLKYDNGLKSIYEDMNSRMEALNEKLEKSSQNVESLNQMFGGESHDEINVEIDKIAKRANIEKKINDLILKRDNLPDGEEKNRLDIAIEKLKKEKDRIHLSTIGKKIESDNLQVLQDELKLRNEIKDSVEDNSVAQKEYNELLRQNADRTKKAEASLKVLSAIWKGITKLAKDGYEQWKKIDEEVFVNGRKAGISSAQLRALQVHTMKDLGKMASRLGMSMEDLNKIQTNYNENIGRSTILRDEERESLAGLTKLIGENAVNEMTKNMDNFGASAKSASSYLALHMARAKQNGLNITKSSEAFAKNIKMASKYTFKEGINGVSKMTLLSERLKFNLESIGNAADKFSTIEGAISASAQLQMLGGSYAMNFGNPLEVMGLALTDFEGFTNKFIKTFSSKAIFNREKGVVEMSPIDKRLLKHAAEAAGITYEEAWNMSSQQAKIAEMKHDVDKTSLSEEDKNYVYSNAQFDPKTKEFFLTYLKKDENGNYKEENINIEKLDKATLDQIKGDSKVEKSIQGDVKGIHDLLKNYIRHEVDDTKTFNETILGIDTSAKNTLAGVEDNVLQPAKEKAKEIGAGDNSDTVGILGKFLIGVLSAGGIGITGYFAKKYTNLFRKSLGKGGAIPRGSGASPSGGGGSPRGGGASPSGGGGSSRGGGNNARPNRGTNSSRNNRHNRGRNNRGPRINPRQVANPNAAANAARNANAAANAARNANAAANATRGASKATGRIGKVLSKIPKVGKIFALGTALFGGYALANASNNNTPTPQVPISSGGGDVLSELSKQTTLLQKIAEGQGVDTTFMGGTSLEQADTQEEPLFTAKDGIGLAITTQTGRNLITKGGEYAAKGVSKITGKEVISGGAKLAAKSATKGMAGPLGWGGLGLDVVNELGKGAGYWEEGGAVDKTMGIGSWALTGAGVGSLFGPIGTAVGAGIGTLVGVIDEFGDDIADFFTGTDNMTSEDKSQLEYEEGKLGKVSINDPALMEKAAFATCKMHDLLISIWHHMNGKQSNGLEEDKGLLGDVGGVLSKTSDIAVSLVTSPFKMAGNALNSLGEFIIGDGEEENKKSTFESVTIDDPELMKKAALATCKIHDILEKDGNKSSGGVAGAIGNIVEGGTNLIVDGWKKVVEIKDTIGDKISNFFGFNDEKDEAKANSKVSNTMFESVTIDDPELMKKAALATCKIHDILEKGNSSIISSEKSEKVTKEEKTKNIGDFMLKGNPFVSVAKSVIGKVGDFFGGLFGSDNSNNSDVISSDEIEKDNSVNFKDITIDDPELMKKAALATCKIHDIMSSRVSEVPFESNTIIKSEPVIGRETYIRNNTNETLNNNISTKNDISLNINGTIKLVSDKGSSSTLDLNSLINDPQFKSKLVDLVHETLIMRANNGLGLDKGSVPALTRGYGGGWIRRG